MANGELMAMFFQALSIVIAHPTAQKQTMAGVVACCGRSRWTSFDVLYRCLYEQGLDHSKNAAVLTGGSNGIG